MPREARNHKEFILRHYGLKHALQPTAEAGVDLSNVPGNYVSLLPDNPTESAETIKKMIYQKSGKDVEVIIMDTDPTYKLGNVYFTTLPQSVDMIKNDMGVYGYFLRSFSKNMGATILATTVNIALDELISMANLAEECQKEDSTDFFETIYNMKDKFNVDVDEISVDMLSSVEHIPAIIIRKKKYL
jgi:F420-0:gamma-glutamyl ligase-like protein